MSKDPFSLDSILEELKKEQSEYDSKEITEYISEQEKFSTQALLDEILGHKEETASTHFASSLDGILSEATAEVVPNPVPKQEPEPENSPAESSLTDAAPVTAEKQSAEDLPVPSTEEAPKAEPSSEESSAEESAPEEDNASVKITQSTEKSIYKSILSETTKLKYLNLKKSREERVKNFVLTSDFTDSLPNYKNLSPEEVGGQFNIEAREKESDQPSAEEPVHTSRTIKMEKNFVEQWREKMAEDAEELSNLDQFQEYTDPAQTEQVLSTLQEMKRELISKLWILGILFLLSGTLSLLDDLFVLSPVPFLSVSENPVVFCLLQTVFLAGTFITCFDTVKNGVLELVRKEPGKNAIYSLSLLGMLVFAIVLLTSPKEASSLSVQLYIPFLIFTFFVMTVGRLIGLKRILTNFLLVSGDYPDNAKYSISVLENQPLAEELTKGALQDFPALVHSKKTAFLSDFFNESFSEDLTDRAAKYLVPIVSGIALLTAVLSVVLGNTVFSALSVFSGILTAGCGVLTFLIINYPLYTCSKELSRLGGAVLGYHAADYFSDINSALVEANDLFNKENVTLYGIKTFSSLPVDQVIINATSVLCDTKSILSGVFLDIINNRQDFLLPVDTVLYEDGMGISAWVNNSRVLIGSREMMINHNIPVPEESYEKKFLKKGRRLLYIATSGELSAIFIIGISGSEETRNMLVDLYNNNIACIVKAVDPFLTKEFLTNVFDMPEDTFRVLPSHLHKDCAEIGETAEAANGAVCSNGHFPAYVYGLLSAKRLNKIFRLGMVLQYVSIALSVLLLVIFALIPGGLHQLSNTALCLLSAIWLTISFLIQKTVK